MLVYCPHICGPFKSYVICCCTVLYCIMSEQYKVACLQKIFNFISNCLYMAGPEICACELYHVNIQMKILHNRLLSARNSRIRCDLL